MIVIESALHGWTAAQPHLDLFGTLGLLLGFAAGIMPHRGGMLLASAGCATAFGLHYLHLGALTGTAMCAIALVQNLVSARASRLGAAPPGWSRSSPRRRWSPPG